MTADLAVSASAPMTASASPRASRPSHLAVVTAAGLFFGVAACTTTATNDRPAVDGGVTPTAQEDAAAPDAPPSHPWSTDDAVDYEAYCLLYSKAESMTSGCQWTEEAAASHLASCAKSRACTAAVFEPDFLQRQRDCLSQKSSCQVSYAVSCEDTAAETYTDATGASLRLACTAKVQYCKSSRLGVSCAALKALKAPLRTALLECFAESQACTDVRPCIANVLGPECGGGS